MHELRRGELARAGEMPHSPYYGTHRRHAAVAGAARRDLALARRPRAARRADAERRARARAGSSAACAEGNGWVRYQRAHDKGLENQGWKDRRDGVSFPDGTIAPAADRARRGAGLRGRRARGDGACSSASSATRARAEQLAGAGGRAAPAHPRGVLGARDRLLRARPRRRRGGRSRPSPRTPATSCSSTRVPRERVVAARRRAARPRACTTAGACARWRAVRRSSIRSPITTARCGRTTTRSCALGAARHGRGDAALRILEGLYDASLHFRRGRLPELFCGLGRGEGDFLVHYPVSCSPQAWASGAFFLLLQACLGLRPDAAERRAGDPRSAAAGVPRRARSVRHARGQRARVAALRAARRAHALRRARGDRRALRVNIEVTA